MPCYQGTGLGCPVALLAGFPSKQAIGGRVGGERCRRNGGDFRWVRTSVGKDNRGELGHTSERGVGDSGPPEDQQQQSVNDKGTGDTSHSSPVFFVVYYDSIK